MFYDVYLYQEGKEANKKGVVKMITIITLITLVVGTEILGKKLKKNFFSKR